MSKVLGKLVNQNRVQIFIKYNNSNIGIPASGQIPYDENPNNLIDKSLIEQELPKGVRFVKVF